MEFSNVHQNITTIIIIIIIIIIITTMIIIIIERRKEKKVKPMLMLAKIVLNTHIHTHTFQ